MNRVKGRVVEIGISETFGVSSGALGLTVVDGVTIETEDGDVDVPYAIAGGRVMTILDRALESGVPADILMTGPSNTRLIYAIRAGADSAYDPTPLARDLWLQVLRYAILGVLSLFFVVGAFILLYAAWLAFKAVRFRRPVSRASFMGEAGTDTVSRGIAVAA